MPSSDEENSWRPSANSSDDASLGLDSEIEKDIFEVEKSVPGLDESNGKKSEDNSKEKELEKEESYSLDNSGICREARKTKSSTSFHQNQNEFTATELREDWTDNEEIPLIPDCNSNIQLFTDLQDKNEASLVFLDGVEITYLDSNGLEIEYSDINKENQSTGMRSPTKTLSDSDLQRFIGSASSTPIKNIENVEEHESDKPATVPNDEDQLITAVTNIHAEDFVLATRTQQSDMFALLKV